MLNWIGKLTRPPMSHLLPRGVGAGASPCVPPQATATAGWLAPLLDGELLRSLAASRAPVTLFAPTDIALRRAGVSPQTFDPATQQAWLMRHLTLLDSPADSLVRMLDGSLMRRDGARHWLDAGGVRVLDLGPGEGRGTLRVRLLDRPLEPAAGSVWEQLAAEPGLARFAGALDRTGLAPLLNCTGPFTVFAPSDVGLERAAARMGLARRALESDTVELGRLLRQHIVPGRWSSRDLPWGGGLNTWADAPLHFTPLGQLRAGGCLLQTLAPGSDQPCRNGVLHRLHHALLPAD
ncbi:MAG: hypothetical protein EOP35_01845 [Rubrivivax sp.]|nr:MAG: hypothetical protein EOP35_01845 [Rubrivivax sp.]